MILVNNWLFGLFLGWNNALTKLLISRNMLGESLSGLNFKELKNMETRLEKGISRIRSKKVFTIN